MSPEETIALCRLVKAVCPSQALDQYTPDAWALILRHIDYNDAKQAVIDIASQPLEPGRSRYIEPGHIVAQVKRICVANRWRFFEEEGQIEDVDSMMLAQNAVDVPHIHV